MTDTAADITAALNSLDGSNIASITISDNGAIGVSVAQLTSDATAISKLADQSESLSARGNRHRRGHHGRAQFPRRLQHRLNHDLRQGAVGVSVAQLTSDATTIGKLANAAGLSISLRFPTPPPTSGGAGNSGGRRLEHRLDHISTSGTVVVSVSTLDRRSGRSHKIGGTGSTSPTLPPT